MIFSGNANKTLAKLVAKNLGTTLGKATVKTFSDGEISFSDSIEVDPDKVFSCGTIVKHRGETWRIRALHSGTARTLRGNMVARNIRRIFLHRPPTPDEIAAKKKVDRGNWKGQDFPGREEHQQKWRDQDDEDSRRGDRNE